MPGLKLLGRPYGAAGLGALNTQHVSCTYASCAYLLAGAAVTVRDNAASVTVPGGRRGHGGTGTTWGLGALNAYMCACVHALACTGMHAP